MASGHRFSDERLHLLIAIHEPAPVGHDAHLVIAHLPVNDQLLPETTKDSQAQLVLKDGSTPSASPDALHVASALGSSAEPVFAVTPHVKHPQNLGRVGHEPGRFEDGMT